MFIPFSFNINKKKLIFLFKVELNAFIPKKQFFMNNKNKDRNEVKVKKVFLVYVYVYI